MYICVCVCVCVCVYTHTHIYVVKNIRLRPVRFKVMFNFIMLSSHLYLLGLTVSRNWFHSFYSHSFTFCFVIQRPEENLRHFSVYTVY